MLIWKINAFPHKIYPKNAQQCFLSAGNCISINIHRALLVLKEKIDEPSSYKAKNRQKAAI